MCTGRVDLAFMLRAFREGADGVIIGGCWPGECHYVTEGNYDALGNTLLCKKLLGYIGVNHTRLRLEWIASSEGSRFAEIMSGFASELRELGPLGSSEELEEPDLGLRLDALNSIVPYMKLVEREKLRVPVKSEEAYREFYESDATNRMLHALVDDNLAISRIMKLLGDGPLSTGELSERLGLDPSAVARHMNSSSRQGLVRYDVDLKCYALA